MQPTKVKKLELKIAVFKRAKAFFAPHCEANFEVGFMDFKRFGSQQKQDMYF
jgi:hypothetical protein